MAAAGRFPLHPGKPLVFRRPNGAWGYSCNCTIRSATGRAYSSDLHNCDDWAHALREALSHIKFSHKSAAELEVEALEALYAAPAHEETTHDTPKES